MATFFNEDFTNQTVEVDGNQYELCTFTGCSLVYSGGEVPVFERCSFSQTSIQLEDNAYNTVQYLKDLSSSGASPAVDRVIERVKKGLLPLAGRPEPCDGVNTGTHYGRLALISGALIGTTLLIMAFLWYGLLIYPQDVVLGGEETRPLREEIPLEVMPALPDDLALVYDQNESNQNAFLNSYGWANRGENVGRIPIGVAFDIVLESGLPSAWGGE